VGYWASSIPLAMVSRQDPPGIQRNQRTLRPLVFSAADLTLYRASRYQGRGSTTSPKKRTSSKEWWPETFNSPNGRGIYKFLLVYYLKPIGRSQNHPPSPPSDGRKRPRRVADSVNSIPTERPRKRLRPLPAPGSPRQTIDQEAASAVSASQRTHISHWAEQKTWPKEYFQEDSMHHLIARQKSSASLRRKRSDASLTTSMTPSDQRPREEKSAPYRNASYPTLLKTLGDSYMYQSELGVTDASKLLYQSLLSKEYTTPRDTLFRDDVFHTACQNLQDRNEARIIQDIARLLAPSPESLAAFGAKILTSWLKALTRAGTIVFLSQPLVRSLTLLLALA